MITYKYRSGRGTKDSEGKDVFERDMELLQQDTIYIPTVEQLNDPAEALVDDSVFKAQLKLLSPLVSDEVLNRLQENINGFFDKIRSCGIYSLSKEIRNELMWAYYASGHTGYAIIYNTDVLINSFEQGRRGGMYEIDVKYSAKIPRFDISKIDKQMEEILSCVVGTKSKAWAHEAEHRLIFDNGGRQLKIDYRAIKGFVFGCRMNRDDIDYVMKLFAGRDLEYYQIKLKEDSYKLVLNKLSDNYPTTEKYCPNNVIYNVDALLEYDKCVGGVGYRYRVFVEDALKEVIRDPFVTSISHIIVSDDKRYPHIKVWTKIHQDGSFKKMRLYEFDVIDGLLVKTT